MRNADPRTRTLFYAVVESYSYRIGSGTLAQWLADRPLEHLAAFTEQAHKYGYPREFDALCDWLSSNGWSYGLTTAEIAHRGTVHIADANRNPPIPTHALVAEGSRTLLRKAFRRQRAKRIRVH